MSVRYTIRLKPERDADLIAWLNGLGEGERSCFIRQALRHSLSSKITNPQPIPFLPLTAEYTQETADEALDSLKNRLNRLTEGL